MVTRCHRCGSLNMERTDLCRACRSKAKFERRISRFLKCHGKSSADSRLHEALGLLDECLVKLKERR